MPVARAYRLGGEGGGLPLSGGTLTGPLCLPDGSAAAPSLCNDGDSDTGIYWPAANTCAITTGGTERFRILSNGRISFLNPAATNFGLNIGTDSGIATIAAYHSATNVGQWTQNALGMEFKCALSSAAILFKRDTTTDIRIDGVGVGIRTSPSDLLHVSTAGDSDAFRIDDTTGHVGIGQSPNGGVKLWLESTASNLMRFAYDTSNYQNLSVSSVGQAIWETVGTSTSFDLRSEGVDDAGVRKTVLVRDQRTVAADVGGTLMFGYRTGTLAAIRANKVNATDPHNSGHLDFYSRADGSNLALNMRLDSAGSVRLENGLSSAADASSLLDMVSTTKGFLPPRMTTTQRDNISSPATGLVIYNTSTNVLNFYNGTSWGAV